MRTMAKYWFVFILMMVWSVRSWSSAPEPFSLKELRLVKSKYQKIKTPKNVTKQLVGFSQKSKVLFEKYMKSKKIDSLPSLTIKDKKLILSMDDKGPEVEFEPDSKTLSFFLLNGRHYNFPNTPKELSQLIKKMERQFSSMDSKKSQGMLWDNWLLPEANAVVFLLAIPASAKMVTGVIATLGALAGMWAQGSESHWRDLVALHDEVLMNNRQCKNRTDNPDALTEANIKGKKRRHRLQTIEDFASSVKQILVEDRGLDCKNEVSYKDFFSIDFADDRPVPEHLKNEYSRYPFRRVMCEKFAELAKCLLALKENSGFALISGRSDDNRYWKDLQGHLNDTSLWMNDSDSSGSAGAQ